MKMKKKRIKKKTPIKFKILKKYIKYDKDRK